MRRTTIYLDAELEMLLRAEALRQRQPMAEIIRSALRERFAGTTRPRSAHAGAFGSGCNDTASRVGEVLEETGFGRT